MKDGRFNIDFFEFNEIINNDGDNSFVFKDLLWKKFMYNKEYVISCEGHVISLKNMNGCKNSKGARFYLLKPREEKKGYLTVSLNKNNKSKVWKIHRLVAISFLNFDIDSDLLIDHIDEDKTNNSVFNLQFLSNRQNVIKSLKKKNNKVGYYWNKPKNRWTAQIEIEGRKIHLGHFKKEEDAANYYKEALENVLKGCPENIRTKPKIPKSSKYKGVTKTKRGKYRASFRYKNEFYSAGTFDLELDAYNAYLKHFKEITND